MSAPYAEVNGLDQLQTILEQLRSDPQADQFILYKLGKQQSMLYVAEKRVLHCDLESRAITEPVRTAISSQLPAFQLIDVSGEENRRKLLAALTAGSLPDLSASAVLTPEQAMQKIQRQKQVATLQSTQQTATTKSPLISPSTQELQGHRAHGLWGALRTAITGGKESTSAPAAAPAKKSIKP